MDVGVATFPGVHGAERAFAQAHDRDPGAGWLGDAAFVEAHRRGRIVVRGNVLGHYVDVDGDGDAMGRDTAIGTIVGAAVGFPLGPPAFALGVVGGATVGGAVETGTSPKPEGPAVDAIRDHVPEGFSAVVVVSDTERVGAMADALGTDADKCVHYRLSATAEAGLRSALADARTISPQSG